MVTLQSPDMAIPEGTAALGTAEGALLGGKQAEEGVVFCEAEAIAGGSRSY